MNGSLQETIWDDIATYYIIGIYDTIVMGFLGYYIVVIVMKAF